MSTIFPLPKQISGQVAAFEKLYARCHEIIPVEGKVHNPVGEDPKVFSQELLPKLDIKA